MFVLLENVAAIDDDQREGGAGGAKTGVKNLDIVKEALNARGYIVLAEFAEPRTQGCPHRRLRCWIIALLVSMQPLGKEDVEAKQYLADEVNYLLPYLLTYLLTYLLK